MNFDWLKHYMPRSLYGRAALILVVPVLVVQLVVSVTFIQRHFEDVTRQMTLTMVREITYLGEGIAAAEDRVEALRAGKERGVPLNLRLEFDESGEIRQDAKLFYDISGIWVIQTLHDELPAIQWIDLATDTKRVTLGFETRFGPMTIEFDRERVSASNPHQLLVLMVGTAILMTLIAFIYLRNQLRPIRRLARAAEAFGKGQRIDYRPAGAVEVRSAGSAFLAMRNRIERHIDQRTQMLSGVSHDLRTPLTRLRLGLELLEEGEAEDLKRDVAEMEALVDSFLDFARGDATEDLVPTDPVALTSEVVAAARRDGHDVSLIPGAGEAAEVMMRPVSVRRALTNLVVNATRHGEKVELSVSLFDASVRFTVEDDGPGIPPERRDEALNPFSRLDDARNQDRGAGVGLGLSIAADVARGHGGMLRLGESERLGGLKAELLIAR